MRRAHLLIVFSAFSLTKALNRPHALKASIMQPIQIVIPRLKITTAVNTFITGSRNSKISSNIYYSLAIRLMAASVSPPSFFSQFENPDFLRLLGGVAEIFLPADLRGIDGGLSASETNPHLFI